MVSLEKKVRSLYRVEGVQRIAAPQRWHIDGFDFTKYAL
jgi:hypothetical protein